ncbi:MAG TPA: signal peptidase I [Pseudomonadales bacterium]|nr:signal peptidase I [Pseudomonadales bacterium]
MRLPRPIFSLLAVRLKWMRRQQWRRFKKFCQPVVRWVSINSLRYSWGRLMGDMGSVTWLLCLAMLSFLFISHFVFESVQVQGSSMYPTLFNSNFYWLNKFAYVIGQPHRGDIVAIKDPSGHGFDVKRIIATPDQSIYISNGKVYVDGQVLQEPYLPLKMRTFAYEKSEDEFYCLAPDQYFVMGDNRGNSCDSRSFGPIKRNAILGRVIR